MAALVETLTVGDLSVRIEADPEPLDPRTECDNLGTMVCLHRRYSLGDPHDYRAGDHAGWDDLRAHILRDHPGAVVLPLYLLDHSGLTMSTTDRWFRQWDSAGWDWGQVGFVFAASETIRDEYGARRVSRHLRARVEDVLRAEVAAYDDYLRGDVYAFTVEDAGGRVVDSCGGLVGLDHAVEEARSAAQTLSDGSPPLPRSPRTAIQRRGGRHGADHRRGRRRDRAGRPPSHPGC